MIKGFTRRGIAVALLVLGLLQLSGCATQQQREATVVHHLVLLWFKEDVTEAEVERIRSGSLALAQIEQVRAVRIGDAIESERPVVDDSFDLAVLFEFDSVADMRAYESDPLHKQFVRDNIKGRMSKVVMYDF